MANPTFFAAERVLVLTSVALLMLKELRLAGLLTITRSVGLHAR